MGNTDFYTARCPCGWRRSASTRADANEMGDAHFLECPDRTPEGDVVEVPEPVLVLPEQELLEEEEAPAKSDKAPSQAVAAAEAKAVAAEARLAVEAAEARATAAEARAKAAEGEIALAAARTEVSEQKVADAEEAAREAEAASAAAMAEAQEAQAKALRVLAKAPTCGVPDQRTGEACVEDVVKWAFIAVAERDDSFRDLRALGDKGSFRVLPLCQAHNDELVLRGIVDA